MATPGPPPSPGGHGAPPSQTAVGSSRMTDILSEEGGDNARPQTSGSSRPPPSRRGPPPARSTMASPSNNQNNRPTSSASRMSRTHVPSLTSHAFFRPMSSQRLQAHRSGRPGTHNTQPAASEDGQSDVASQSQMRRSLISNSTIQHGFGAHHDGSELPPPSRGTEFTDPIFPDRGTSNASPTGNTTIRSHGETARLLSARSQRPPAPPHLDTGANYQTGNSQDPSQRSPMSFRSGFHMPNRGEHGHRDSRGHERLSSAASSPNSPAKPAHEAPKSNLGKNYEYFLGNMVFFGGGRFMNSRDKPVNIATGLFVVIPTALFFGFSAPWLWHNISPAIPILFAYLFYICFSSFLHASVVDPGIIPRNLHQMPPTDPTEDPLALGPPTNDWVMIKLANSETAAMDVPVKYCRTCNIWRPPRCYHCRVCDNCVETLDHHCVWLNNCVGRRNYRYFFGFVSSATLLALFLIGASLAHVLVYMNREGISFGKSIDKWRVPFAMVIYGAIAFPYPASLWLYHLFLMGRGETTREHLAAQKFPKADRHRPFTQGNVFRNWAAVLGRPRAPTYLKFKMPYQEGDQRLAFKKRKDWPRDLEAQAGGVEMQKVNTNNNNNSQPPRSGGSKKPTPDG